MGTRRSRHQTTIHGKNLLSQCCQACHRASAGGLLRRKPVKPESSHWSRARCVLMWKKEGPGRFPPGRKLCTSNSTNPKAGSPGIMLRLKARVHLVAVRLLNLCSPVWHRGVPADGTSPVEVPAVVRSRLSHLASGQTSTPLSDLPAHVFLFIKMFRMIEEHLACLAVTGSS